MIANSHQLATDSQHLVLAASFSNLLKTLKCLQTCKYACANAQGIQPAETVWTATWLLIFKGIFGEGTKNSKHPKTLKHLKQSLLSKLLASCGHLDTWDTCAGSEKKTNSPWTLRQTQDLAERKEPPQRGILLQHMGSLDQKCNSGKPLDVCPPGFPQTSLEQLANHRSNKSSLQQISNAQRRQAPGFERLVRGNQTQNHLAPSQNSLTLSHTWKAGKELIRVSRLKTRQKYQDNLRRRGRKRGSR